MYISAELIAVLLITIGLAPLFMLIGEWIGYALVKLWPFVVVILVALFFKATIH